MRTALFLLGAVLIISCGSDDEDTGSLGTAPTISNLTSSRDSARIGEGGGFVFVVVSMDFVDPDGDCDFIRTRYRPCGTGDWEYDNADVPPGFSGATSGTLSAAFPMDTVSCPPVVNDTIQFCVFDKQGNQSNILHGSFEFYE
jgi:hypothetical protein